MDVSEDFSERDDVDVANAAAPAPALMELIRTALALSAQRRRFLPGLTLEDPRWLMALELLLAAEEGRDFTVTNLTAVAKVPFTTALRHINAMVSEGLLQRIAHPTDGRVAFVKLSPDLARDLAAFLTATVPPTGDSPPQQGIAGEWSAIASCDQQEREAMQAPRPHQGANGQDRSGAADAPGASEWRCIERANGRYVSTILTKGDVAISLVVRQPEVRMDDPVGHWPMRGLVEAVDDERASATPPEVELSIQF